MREVTVHLVGGLGNQMFQYAAALGLAARISGRVIIDVTHYAVSTQRRYELDQLRVPQEFLLGEPAPLPGPGRFVDRVRRRLRNGGRALPRGDYTEPHFHFDPAFLKIGGEGNIRIQGYFQSPLYFAGVEDRLRSEFRLRDPLGAGASEVMAKIEKAGPLSVSLHIRRGDYVADGNSRTTSNTLDPAYYDRAIHIIRRLLGAEPSLFVFSDEPEHAEQLFSAVPRCEIVHGDIARGWEDLAVMSACRHHIIANSSFSWWGAWLNPRPDRIVIAPARWFDPERLATMHTLDLFPDDWILLK